jgi:hypothetical protein
MSASVAPSSDRTREIDPAALRAFSRRFPGVTLTGSFAWRSAVPPYHCFHFEGEIATLLRFGLIEERMVPPRPKRKACGPYGEEHWHTTRGAGEHLRVSRFVSDSNDRAHPLALYSPSNYPFVETAQEARKEYRRDLVSTAAYAGDFARGALRGYLKGGRWGLCIAKDDRARMDAIAAEFCEALRRAAQAAQIVPEHPPTLRLVAPGGAGVKS